MKLTDRRRFILCALDGADGALLGKHISHRDRSLASRMQAEGLVKWERTDFRAYKNLDGWTLHITDLGRAALAQQGSKP